MARMYNIGNLKKLRDYHIPLQRLIEEAFIEGTTIQRNVGIQLKNTTF